MTAAVKTATLAGALVAAQAAMPPVLPDAVNPHFKSKFVSLDHLIAKTRPVLNKHGLAITQAPTHIDGQPALETTIHHEGGESVTSTMPLLLGGTDMQKLGAALTYARRYAWAAALGICADEDDDGNSAADAATKPAGEAAGTPGAGAAGTDGSAKAAPAPPTTTELRAQYETLARSWARMEQTFDATASVRKADEKLASAKAANDAEPYRKFLTAQVESFMSLINRRNADLEAAAAFPIPETNLEAAGKA